MGKRDTLGTQQSFWPVASGAIQQHLPAAAWEGPEQFADWHLWGPTIAPLLATPAMQRLASIAQLGFVDRVWPPANHTRLMHSLGSYDLARQIIESLGDTVSPQGRALFSREAIQTFLLAALLHDVGHYPLSHSLDGLASLLPSHERVGRELIEHSQLATILERAYRLSPARIADLIDPPPQAERQHLAAGEALLCQLLSGPCDVDKLDYVARDARGCHVVSGQIPGWKLRHALTVAWSETSGEPRLALAAEALGALRAWLQVRQRLYTQVYWHPVNRAYTIMLARAVQDALEGGTLSLAWLQNAHDAALLDLLRTSTMPKSTRLLTQNLCTRHPYQPVLSITPHQASLFPQLLRLAQDAQRRTWVERQLVWHLMELCKTPIDGHEVLLDLVRPKQWDLSGWIISHQPLSGRNVCLSWPQALGFGAADLTCSVQRPARVLVAPHLVPLFQGQERQAIAALLEQIVSNMR